MRAGELKGGVGRRPTPTKSKSTATEPAGSQRHKGKSGVATATLWRGESEEISFTRSRGFRMTARGGVGRVARACLEQRARHAVPVRIFAGC